MIDTHAHLNLCQSTIETLIQNAKKAGLTHIVNVGLDVETSLKNAALAARHPMIIPTIGIHPNNIYDSGCVAALFDIAKTKKYHAVGEIGLDYYRPTHDKQKQKELFISQLEMAVQLDLPIIIHQRHAEEDMIKIISQFPKIKKVFHCFSSAPSFLDAVDGENSFFSFTGHITYSKKGKTIQSLKKLPLEKIMVETDCPYLTPKRHKGAENEPAFVNEVIQHIAFIKKLAPELVAKKTSHTAHSFFSISSS